MDQRLAGKAISRALPTFGIETVHIVEPVAHAIEPRFARCRCRQHNRLQSQLEPFTQRPRPNPRFRRYVIRSSNQPRDRRMRRNLPRGIQSGGRFYHRQQRQPKLRPDHGHRGDILNFRQHNQIRRATLERGNVVGVMRAISRIRPDRDNPATSPRRRKCYRRRPRLRLGLIRHRIFKVDNQHIGV